MEDQKNLCDRCGAPMTVKGLWEDEVKPEKKVEVGKVKLATALQYVLDTYGPMTAMDITKKLVELGLVPSTKNLGDYARYTLNKKKDLFQKVPDRNGLWQALPVVPNDRSGVYPKV
jgi:uncharacterized protein YwgA